MPSWRHSVGISHLQPVNQSHVHVYTTVYLLSVLESERLLDSKRRTTTSTRFDLKFFRVLSKKIDTLECFNVLSSPEIFALLFLLEELKTSPDR